jgi:hypothetical protein
MVEVRHTGGFGPVYQACCARDVDSPFDALCHCIFSAAGHPRVRMVCHARSTNARTCPKRHAPWFDADCRAWRLRVRRAVVDVLALKKCYRCLLRRKTRAYESAVARGFLLAMQHNAGLAVKRFKPRPTRTASPISVEVWTEYVFSALQGGQRCTAVFVALNSQ